MKKILQSLNFTRKNGDNHNSLQSTNSNQPKQAQNDSEETTHLRKIIDCYVAAIFPVFSDEAHVLKNRFSKKLEDSGKLATQDFLKFFQAFRLRESEYVLLSLKTLRNSIWKFVRAFGQEVSFEAASQEEISVLESKLKAALIKSDPLEWKQAIEDAVTTLTAHSRSRKNSFEEKMLAMRNEVSLVLQELEQVKQELDLDGLTKIFNRKAFDEHIERAYSLNNLMKKPLCLLMIDIDHFKQVNDTHGHRKGDEVLKAVATITLQQFFTKADFVARYGGEEICVVIEGENLTDTSARVLQYLKALRALEIDNRDTKIKVTASVGLGQLARKESVPQFIERVDAALYKAKNSGRDKMCLG